ncbi:hypothetical protein PUN28_004002 [Cardiocondyla obscurior]|uniref:Uncharacterized protein n=1 Tax=Cardiocondyla obscurior TaxID=286306 RepID=A0AAW2GPB1_9HYME
MVIIIHGTSFSAQFRSRCIILKLCVGKNADLKTFHLCRCCCFLRPPTPTLPPRPSGLLRDECSIPPEKCIRSFAHTRVHVRPQCVLSPSSQHAPRTFLADISDVFNRVRVL